LDLLSAPFIIPSAVRIPLERIEAQASALPPEGRIVIYCTCPSQASSSRALQLLQRHGFKDVRVLSGGFQAWRAKGFETQAFQFDSSETRPLRALWAF
jgi:rhodanese-related sulfurtransferase